MEASSASLIIHGFNRLPKKQRLSDLDIILLPCEVLLPLRGCHGLYRFLSIPIPGSNYFLSTILPRRFRASETISMLSVFIEKPPQMFISA